MDPKVDAVPLVQDKTVPLRETIDELIARLEQTEVGQRIKLAYSFLEVEPHIAWQQLDDAKRKEIVAILRRHPRFDDDFAHKMPSTGDDARWIFQHAATWPDQARGLPPDQRRIYDKPTWHYVNFPLFVGPERPTTFNVSLEMREADKGKYNIAQATNLCREVTKSKLSPSTKAIGYCWLFNLVGDLHQPMHSTALVAERFPEGDRGGNSIPLRRGANLHALWDNLLGRQDRMQDVAREIAELRAMPELWDVDASGDVSAWVAESHALARAFAYDPIILAAVEKPGELAPIELPESYMKEAGAHARRRVVVAGLRLAVLLGGSADVDLADDGGPVADAFAEATARPAPRVAPTPRGDEPSAELTHWLNLNGNVRHNSSCQWFQKTKRGRMCSADEGRSCGQCGG